MTTTTTGYSLSKPDHLSQSGWDTLLNSNFDTLDALLSGSSTLLTLKGSTTGKVMNGLQAALAGTPGQTGMESVNNYGQLAFVEGTFASPVNAGAGAGSPPQVNIQRYIKPNTDGTSANANAGVFVSATRYGTGSAGDGDAHDYYNVFSGVASSSTADIAPAGGHSVIGAGFLAKALTGSTKARAFGLIALTQLDSGTTSAKAIAAEFDATNNSGTDAPDVSGGQVDGMTIGGNFAGFGTKKNSSAQVIQANSVSNSWLQGLTFWGDAIAPGGYLLNASLLTGVNVFRLSNTSLLSTAAGLLTLDSTGTGVQIASSGNKVGFYGITPVSRQVLATGTGKTVDNVITALQNLGLVSQV